MPAAWDGMSLRHIRAFGSDFDITVARVADGRLRITVARPGAKPKIYRAGTRRDDTGETNRLTIRFTYEPFPLLRHFVCIVLRGRLGSSGPGTDFKVASPDGTLCVGIRAADSLTYTVTCHGTPRAAAFGHRAALLPTVRCWDAVRR